MEIKFYGANCIKISTKKVSIVIDDNMESLGKSKIATANDIIINTNTESKFSDEGVFLINSPGEYEVREISVKGIPIKLHYDEKINGTMYSIYVNGVSIAVIGHIAPNLSDDQIEKLGIIDILIVPIGGMGYTLDSISALKIVKSIEPKVVIPTHYASDDINYEIPQSPPDDFLKSFGDSNVEKVESLKIKDGHLPEKLQVTLLEQSSK